MPCIAVTSGDGLGTSVAIVDSEMQGGDAIATRGVDRGDRIGR